MAVLDVQRRGQQIGRIRLGQMVAASNGKMRPAKLDHFRFTTASRVAADAIAELYGGEVRDWQRGQFEVITKKSEIGVTVPPRDQVISQWYEMWNKGGAVRRCDSQHEQISNGPCLCPHAQNPDDEDEVARCALERSALASQKTPAACKIVTRISVMIPDLPGLGVFRLDTGSYYAAVEIGDAAAIMQLARDQGTFLPAMLRIEHRSRVANGQTKKYPVPVLELLSTLRQITSGALEAGGITAQLPPAPGEQPKAIAAAPPPVPAAESVAQPAPPLPDVPADEPGLEDWERAEQIAAKARSATSRRGIEACAAEAEDKGLADEHVCSDRQNDTWEPLKPYLQDLWRKQAAA